jgi:hypothetical protein
MHRPVPGSAIVLGAAGVLALGGFAYFAASGVSSENELASKCAPTCDPSQVDPIKRRYLVADVMLVSGVLALAAATWIFLTRAEVPVTRPTGSR